MKAADIMVSPSLGKHALAFGVGLISVVVAIFLHGQLGTVASLAGIGGCCLAGQFLLSRGNPYAFLDDGPLIVTMNAALFCLLLLVGGFELFWLLVVALVSSYAGTLGASIQAMAKAEKARRRRDHITANSERSQGP